MKKTSLFYDTANMKKTDKVIYKLMYYFLAVIPQFVVSLFGFFVAKNGIAFLLDTSEEAVSLMPVMLLGIIWMVLFGGSYALGWFGRLHIELAQFKSDVLNLLGYALLVGVLAGVVVGLIS